MHSRERPDATHSDVLVDASVGVRGSDVLLRILKSVTDPKAAVVAVSTAENLLLVGDTSSDCCNGKRDRPVVLGGVAGCCFAVEGAQNAPAAE